MTLAAAGCQTSNPPASTGSASTGPSSGTAGVTGSSSTGTSSGTTGGVGPCGAGLRWYQDKCAAPDCVSVALYTRCFMDGGALGYCAGSNCTDQFGCGGFGVTCPGGYGCEEFGLFNGVCVDGSDRPINCQSSSTLCPGGDACLDYLGCVPLTCEPSVTGAPCPLDDTGQTRGICCDTSCVKLWEDPSNCGNCGITCSAGQQCVDSVCETVSACAPGQSGGPCPLDGGVGTCCGGQCQASSAECADCGSGNQEASCPFDAGPDYAVGACCGASCVDIFNDPHNCGGCGKTCTGGSICTSEYCMPVFDCRQPENAGSYLPCALDGGFGACCGGACVAPSSSNCGACGATCVPGSGCVDEEFCIPDGGITPECTDDSECATGFHCISGNECLPETCPSMASEISCALDEGAGDFARGLCCDGACLDPTSDAQNCGNCGQSCGNGSCVNQTCHGSCGAEDISVQGYCLARTCEARADGLSCAFGPRTAGTCCAGRCVDQSQDPAHCGSCATGCDSGVCYESACAELGPSNDCGESCPQYTVCAQGGCVDSLCQNSLACADAYGGVGLCCGSGACADPASDPLNCGACGIACTGGSNCVNGVCGQAECSASTEGVYCGPDAGGNTALCPSGCTDITADDQNCGGCAESCPPRSRCTNGTCR